MLLKYSKVRDVKNPCRAHPTDAGIDFFVPNDFSPLKLAPHQSILIPSGIKIEIPFGHMGLFLNKSGIAANKKLIVGAQVIDTFYDGEVHIDIHNIGDTQQHLNPGDKIIQLIIVPILSCNLIEVSEIDLYDWMKENKLRGNLGFGSSNK